MYGDQTNISLISTFCRKRGNESAVRRKNEHNEEIIKLGTDATDTRWFNARDSLVNLYAGTDGSEHW